MNIFIKLFIGIAMAVFTTTASARNDVANFSIAEVMAGEQAKSILGDNVAFYFGAQPHPEIVQMFSEYGINRKTNGANKSDKDACEWVFLTAMKALRDRAKSVGANAVVNIRSNYQNNTTTSTETFQCGSGTFTSGVALLGDVVKIKAP